MAYVKGGVILKDSRSTSGVGRAYLLRGCNSRIFCGRSRWFLHMKRVNTASSVV